MIYPRAKLALGSQISTLSSKANVTFKQYDNVW